MQESVGIKSRKGREEGNSNKGKDGNERKEEQREKEWGESR